jgi:hypothetical protein
MLCGELGLALPLLGVAVSQVLSELRVKLIAPALLFAFWTLKACAAGFVPPEIALKASELTESCRAGVVLTGGVKLPPPPPQEASARISAGTINARARRRRSEGFIVFHPVSSPCWKRADGFLRREHKK